MKRPKNIRIMIVVLLLLLPFTNHAEIMPKIVGGVESNVSDWPFMAALIDTRLNGSIIVAGHSFMGFPIKNTKFQEFSGKIINCEQGLTICQNAYGKVCLIERGTNTGTEKIQNCKAGGGIAAVIYNNEINSIVDVETADMPAISTSRTNGLLLLNQVDNLIQFEYRNESFCGGSYIGGKWIVTAAHCFNQIDADSIVVHLGGHNLEINQGNIFSVKDVAIHKDYNDDTYDNDIAIIELASEPKGIPPVLIADELTLSFAIDQQLEATVIGRGLKAKRAAREIPRYEYPDPRLYEVSLALTDNQTCDQLMLEYLENDPGVINKPSIDTELVTNSMVCAGNLVGGLSSCQGDSGGPLIIKQSGKNYLVGLTSWGIGCGLADTFDVYTRVPYFKSDLKKVLDNRLQTTFSSTTTSERTDSGGNWHYLMTLLLLSVCVAFRVTGIKQRRL